MQTMTRCRVVSHMLMKSVINETEDVIKSTQNMAQHANVDQRQADELVKTRQSRQVELYVLDWELNDLKSNWDAVQRRMQGLYQPEQALSPPYLVTMRYNLRNILQLVTSASAWTLAEARIALGNCVTMMYQCMILAKHTALASHWHDMRVVTSELWPDVFPHDAKGDQGDLLQRMYSMLFLICLKGAVAQGHLASTGQGSGNQTAASQPVVYANSDAVQGITVESLLAEVDALVQLPRDFEQVESRRVQLRNVWQNFPDPEEGYAEDIAGRFPDRVIMLAVNLEDIFKLDDCTTRTFDWACSASNALPIPLLDTLCMESLAHLSPFVQERAFNRFFQEPHDEEYQAMWFPQPPQQQQHQDGGNAQQPRAAAASDDDMEVDDVRPAGGKDNAKQQQQNGVASSRALPASLRPAAAAQLPGQQQSPRQDVSGRDAGAVKSPSKHPLASFSHAHKERRNKRLQNNAPEFPSLHSDRFKQPASKAAGDAGGKENAAGTSQPAKQAAKGQNRDGGKHAVDAAAGQKAAEKEGTQRAKRQAATLVQEMDVSDDAEEEQADEEFHSASEGEEDQHRKPGARPTEKGGPRAGAIPVKAAAASSKGTEKQATPSKVLPNGSEKVAEQGQKRKQPPQAENVAHKAAQNQENPAGSDEDDDDFSLQAQKKDVSKKVPDFPERKEYPLRSAKHQQKLKASGNTKRSGFVFAQVQGKSKKQDIGITGPDRKRRRASMPAPSTQQITLDDSSDEDDDEDGDEPQAVHIANGKEPSTKAGAGTVLSPNRYPLRGTSKQQPAVHNRDTRHTSNGSGKPVEGSKAGGAAVLGATVKLMSMVTSNRRKSAGDIDLGQLQGAQGNAGELARQAQRLKVMADVRVHDDEVLREAAQARLPGDSQQDKAQQQQGRLTRNTTGNPTDQHKATDKSNNTGKDKSKVGRQPEVQSDDDDDEGSHEKENARPRTHGQPAAVKNEPMSPSKAAASKDQAARKAAVAAAAAGKAKQAQNKGVKDAFEFNSDDDGDRQDQDEDEIQDSDLEDNGLGRLRPRRNGRNPSKPRDGNQQAQGAAGPSNAAAAAGQQPAQQQQQQGGGVDFRRPRGDGDFLQEPADDAEHKPRKFRLRWTEEEERRLVDLFTEEGPRWAYIKALDAKDPHPLLLVRSGVDLKDKIRNMKKYGRIPEDLW